MMRAAVRCSCGSSVRTGSLRRSRAGSGIGSSPIVAPAGSRPKDALVGEDGKHPKVRDRVVAYDLKYLMAVLNLGHHGGRRKGPNAARPQPAERSSGAEGGRASASHDHRRAVRRAPEDRPAGTPPVRADAGARE